MCVHIIKKKTSQIFLCLYFEKKKKHLVDTLMLVISQASKIIHFHIQLLVLSLQSTHHIIPVLQQLQWLPLKFHINFKMFLWPFKPSTASPLHVCLTFSRLPLPLALLDLLPPSTRLTRIGFRAFSWSPPWLLNS